MRERAFIEQNKEKWQYFENNIDTNLTTDELVHSYLDIKNDLSFAKTYYPKSRLTEYLNRLVVKGHLNIYDKKVVKKGSFFDLWTIHVPKILFEKRRYVYFSFAFFILFVCIGIVSSIYDETFVRMILGDSYVDSTLENIENGDPLAVYSSGSTWGSAIGITVNNIKVGIYSYVMGIFGGIGTLWVLLQNGIMLGSFQYFFLRHDVFIESVSGIWIHGAMEIFAIVIEGAAGLIMGASILFPGTYSRIESFKKGIKDSVKILISTFPFTIAAGFLEGFVTRSYNEMPMPVAFFIIFLTLSIISYYYLIYPIKQNKKHEITKI